MLALTLLAVCGWTVQADAGVAGGHFEGTLKYADGSDAGFVSADFEKKGDGFYDTYSDGDVTESFPGTYSEKNLIIISFWTATYDDYPDYEVSGICFFGVISTYKVEELDGDDDYSGIVIRKGKAQPLPDTPAP
jgi:hypothetical protein